MKRLNVYLCFCLVFVGVVLCEELLGDHVVEEEKKLGEEESLSSFSDVESLLHEHEHLMTVPTTKASSSGHTTDMSTDTVPESHSRASSVHVPDYPSTVSLSKSDSKKDSKKKNKLGYKKKDKLYDENHETELPLASKQSIETTTKLTTEEATETMNDLIPAVTTLLVSETIGTIPDAVPFMENVSLTDMKSEEEHTHLTPDEEGHHITTVSTNPDMEKEIETTTLAVQTMTDESQTMEKKIAKSLLQGMTSTPMLEETTSSNLLIASENDDKSSFGMPNMTDNPNTTFLESEETNLPADINSSKNDTEGNVSIETIMTTPPFIQRQNKQINLNKQEKCPCDKSKDNFDPNKCPAGRTREDPKCSCRHICAKQFGEICNDFEPCDAEFGLKCSAENGTCQGPLTLQLFDVTHNSAKLKWTPIASELQHQALTTVFYTTAFRGPNTLWTKVYGLKPVITLENLLPGKTYYVRVEENGKFEIDTFKTKDNSVGSIPKILIKQRSQTSLTVVWDDFRLPSYHSEYVLEYKPANSSESWTKVTAGTQTIVTVSHLELNTPYNLKVAVWEDEKLELPSEVITAYTADGCTRDNRVYNVGEEYFIECDSQCICKGNNETRCSPRCNAPYVKMGSKLTDSMCYEKPLPSDPCCVTIRCTETKFYGDDEELKNKSGDCPEILEDVDAKAKSCLSDCDHDGDCSGKLKCCPSSCGGAVCVQPLLKEDVCEHIYCGPNAVCVSEKMSCECAEGYEGNPHNFLIGCELIDNSTDVNSSGAVNNRSEFESDLTENEHNGGTNVTENKANESAFRNELETEIDKPSKDASVTEMPFHLDLTSNNSSKNATLEQDRTQNSTFPNDEENFHWRRPQDAELMKTDEDTPSQDSNNQTLDLPTPFDGCEYNNVTYDRGVKFDDGCEAHCTCKGNGYVSCVPRCTLLSAGGPTCKEVQDPDDVCCKIMVCNFPGGTEKEHVEGLPLKILSAEAQNGTVVRIRLGLSMSHLPTMVGRDLLEIWYRESSDSDNDLSQWNKKLITEDQLTEVQQGVFEFDLNDLRPQTDYYIKVGKESQAQGSTNLNMAEFSNTVNVKTFSAAVKSVFQGCFHHNQSYGLGETFYQGCEHKCICRENGFIECQERCEIYIDTIGYEDCDWVQSEEDHCCTIPMCNRRKIPLLPDGRIPFTGNSENICVVDNKEIYRVGDIWESGDGCKTKICRCTLLANGSTSVQCQSQCPPLAPNAHIPTVRCPHPVLIKPDGPCNCPYIVCNEAPRRVIQPPRPQCEYNGHRYDMGQEFHDDCIALCHCGQDLRVNCAAIECPYHFTAEFSNCLEWDIDPNFFPTPPHCCAPAKCKNDGSCMFSNRKFANYEGIPADLLPCGSTCHCVNGNVTCENRCTPIEDVPPVHLPCSPNLAFKGHSDADSCCLQWMCKETTKQNYCTFQGSRYLVSEQWEVQKGSQQKMCSCHLNEMGSPEVECKGNCPQIPQRYLLPTDNCLRPVVVTPDDPLMCPYVVCNNTMAGHELYNVNVVALNSTAVRIRFSLSNILVGLVGHAELHFTTDPTLPPSQWHIQKFSRPKRLFDNANIEYILNALRPNTTYFLQVKIKVDALQGGPASELFKLKMPEEIIATTTTTLPPLLTIDAKAEAHVIDSKTVRISWRNFDSQEKKYIYALQLKYKLQRDSDDRWITTPMIHRDVTSYFLHELEPSSSYVVDVIFTPPKDMPTKIVSTKGVDFKTASQMKDDYHLQVAVEDNTVQADRSSLSFAGIPEPITKYVHVIKIMYKSTDGDQSYSFKVPKSNHIMLDHLKPGKKYLAQLELYLTNGRTLTSNEVEFITKTVVPGVNSTLEKNEINQESHVKGKQAELLQSRDHTEDTNRTYFIALVVVAVVAAVAAFGFVLLLVVLVRRQASAKAPISRTPSESAYDNPTYKTYDGERPEDKANGQTIQTTQT